MDSGGLTLGVLMQVHVSWIDSGTAVFAFRGTESTKDGLQDLKFVRRNIDYLQRAYPGAKAHTGTEIKNIMLRLHALIESVLPLNIWHAGHLTSLSC